MCQNCYFVFDDANFIKQAVKAVNLLLFLDWKFLKTAERC